MWNKKSFCISTNGTTWADSEGGFNQRGIDYYTERAKGGTGLIITGVTFVDNEVEEHGMPNVPCPTHNPV